MSMELSPLTLEEKISDESVRVSKIVASALIAGVLLFFIVCYVLYRLNSSVAPANGEASTDMNTLTLVLMILSAMMFLMAMIIPGNAVKMGAAKLKDKGTDEIDYNELVNLHRTHMIVRSALLEGPALFGLVLLMLSITGNTIYSNPLYWLFTAPMIIFIIVTIINFPTKEKIISFIQEKLSI